MSIDRLTVCGNMCGDLEGFYSRCEQVKSRSFANYPYRHAIYFQDGSVLQKAETETVRSGKIKELRYDFNPNNKKYEKLHVQVVGLMKDVHFTRVDVAFDIYDKDMSKWKWIDSKGRPYNVYYGGTGEVETWYVGGKDSEMRVRIYNKAKEQKLKDKIWWRVEVQMRGEAAKIMQQYKIPYNPFEDITPVVDGGFPELEIKQRAMVKYLIQHPSGFSELSKPSRLEYKKLIRLIASWECIDFYRLWNEKTPLVGSEVQSWLACAKQYEFISEL